jgi:hypothetical protein
LNTRPDTFAAEADEGGNATLHSKVLPRRTKASGIADGALGLDPTPAPSFRFELRNRWTVVPSKREPNQNDDESQHRQEAPQFVINLA